MDNIVGLYTSTEGRISRQSWWLGAVGIIVLNLLITFLIFPMVGLGGPSMQAITEASGDPARLNALVMGSMQTSGWASLILFVIFAYPLYALFIKRRHDKDNNGLDAIIYLVVVAVFMLVQALGLGYSLGEVGGIPMAQPSMLMSIIGVVVLVYAIYMLVVMGFLRGTAGPNQYGPDPLGGAASAAT